ncbi:MAG: two-component system response regulator [Firmicutes bacterium]|nr:two-component system response regulator [Bacillota bacterium]
MSEGLLNSESGLLTHKLNPGSPVRKKILIVDDVEKNLRLLEAMLYPMGHDIMFAKNGKEAIEKVHSNPPDLVLLDIMMPVMNGYEVAEKLKNGDTTRMIPIVMVTALNEVEDRVKALEAGADDFLTKPVEEVELKARITSLLKVKAYNDYMKDYQRILEEEVGRKTLELRRAMDGLKNASLETILRLARASEYRDDDTGDHIKRVSYCSEVIARNMGMSQSFVDAIRYASPMHDVGKIGIPDNILLKPGKLDPEEWEIMKTHTTIGKEILSNSEFEFVKLAEEIAYTHHEKWNGSGYPRGLKGSEIPLSGCITAIIDVFDALLSERPYKKPFPLEKALSIIEEGNGSHFDPDVVSAFMTSLDEIMKIRQLHP